jgi:hypothetical protein
MAGPTASRPIPRLVRALLLVVPLIVIIRVTWLSTRGAVRSPVRASPPIAAFVPESRFRDGYTIDVAAPADVVWEVVHEADWLEAPLVTPAMFVRELPMRLGVGGGGRRQAPVVTLDTLVAMGAFVTLREMPGELLVLGSVGRVWETDYGPLAVPADSFATFRVPGYVRIAWSIEVHPRLQGGTRLLLEWRTAATDPTAERRFLAYWAVAGPAVRVLARSALPWLRDEAERRVREREPVEADSASAPDPAAKGMR